MKKLLNISVVAALAILPLAANADVTTTDPGQTNSEAPTATYAPKYSLKPAGDHDGNLATAGYVKGAYNAAIKAINKVSESTVNAATQNGVVATIESATAEANGVSLTVGGTPKGTIESSLSNTAISGTVTVPTSGTVATLTDWENDTAATASVTLATGSANVTGTVSGDVTSIFTGTGIDNGTATGKIENIDVTVASYTPGA